MGNGYVINCQKCNYKFEAMLGVGMLFPVVYKETVNDISIGIYGDDYKMIFEEHKNAAVNCEDEVAICNKCGKLQTIRNMSLYLPKDDGIEPADYIMPEDLKSDYNKVRDFEHNCSCGGALRIIKFPDELFDGKINCPECGAKLEFDPLNMIFWD
jgi:hypothetical protein